MVGVLGYMPQNFSKASEYASLVLFGFEEGTLSNPSEDIVGSSEPTLTEDTLVSEVRFLLYGSGRWHGKTLAFARCALLSFNALAAPPLAPADALNSLLLVAFWNSRVSRPLEINPFSDVKYPSKDGLRAHHFFMESLVTRDSFLSSSGRLPPAFHIAMRMRKYAPTSSVERDSVSPMKSET